MSLAILCSRWFALRASEMLSVITDSPTPPSKRGSLAGQQLPLSGTWSLTVSPTELDTRQRCDHVCSAIHLR